jgi:hypothetical protein
MIQMTSYNAVDTLRHFVGEYNYREYYNYVMPMVEEGVGTDTMRNKTQEKFKIPLYVAVFIVDAFISIDEENNKLKGSTKYGVPHTEINLNSSNYLQYLQKVVVFNSKIEEGEYDFETNMKARILAIRIREEGTEEEHFEILFDISEFEAHNDQHMVPNYWDDNHQPTLTWKQSKFYPKDGKHREYFSNPMPFELA